jgi:hypothetical protein
VDECRIGTVYSVAKVSRENTGGGEGVVVVKTEPFENKTDLYPNCTSGTYSHKIYKISQRVPWWVKKLIPKGKIELNYETWNAYPYALSIMHVKIKIFVILLLI